MQKEILLQFFLGPAINALDYHWRSQLIYENKLHKLDTNLQLKLETLHM